MASVRLEFELPLDESLTRIRIWEGPTTDGPWTNIEDVTEIGTFPDFIHSFETTNATSVTDWFAISTVDANGVESALSTPLPGGRNTVVNEVTERVLQRGVSASESVVIQETEAVAERFFKVDPYTVDLTTVTYATLTGLSYMVLARLVMLSIAEGGGGESYTAGLVSQKSSMNAKDVDSVLKTLIAEASTYLNIPSLIVMELADIDPTGLGSISTISQDQSRLALTINYE
jgi:hypothetical protein